MIFLVSVLIFSLLLVIMLFIWILLYYTCDSIHDISDKVALFSLIGAIFIPLIITICITQNMKNTRAKINETNVISIYQETTEVKDSWNNTEAKEPEEGDSSWIIKYYDKDTSEVRKFGDDILEYWERKEKVTDNEDLVGTYDFSKFVKKGIVYKYIAKPTN